MGVFAGIFQMVIYLSFFFAMIIILFTWKQTLKASQAGDKLIPGWKWRQLLSAGGGEWL